MKFSTAAISLALLTALTACKGNNASDNAAAVKNTVNAEGNAVIADANYESPCGKGNIDNIGAVIYPSQQTEYDITNPTFTKKRFYYADTDCKTPAVSVLETGHLDVTGKSTKVNGALDVNFNFDKTIVIVQSEAAVSVLNLANSCGINDWALNTERDVSAQAASIKCPGRIAPRSTQEIAQIINNTLFLGANADMDVSKGRPEQLDAKNGFIKK